MSGTGHISNNSNNVGNTPPASHQAVKKFKELDRSVRFTQTDDINRSRGVKGHLKDLAVAFKTLMSRDAKKDDQTQAIKEALKAFIPSGDHKSVDRLKPRQVDNLKTSVTESLEFFGQLHGSDNSTERAIAKRLQEAVLANWSAPEKTQAQREAQQKDGAQREAQQKDGAQREAQQKDGAQIPHLLTQAQIKTGSLRKSAQISQLLGQEIVTLSKTMSLKTTNLDAKIESLVGKEGLNSQNISKVASKLANKEKDTQALVKLLALRESVKKLEAQNTDKDAPVKMQAFLNMMLQMKRESSTTGLDSGSEKTTHKKKQREISLSLKPPGRERGIKNIRTRETVPQNKSRLKIETEDNWKKIEDKTGGKELTLEESEVTIIRERITNESRPTTTGLKNGIVEKVKNTDEDLVAELQGLEKEVSDREDSGKTIEPKTRRLLGALKTKIESTKANLRTIQADLNKAASDDENKRNQVASRLATKGGVTRPENTKIELLNALDDERKQIKEDAQRELEEFSNHLGLGNNERGTPLHRPDPDRKRKHQR